MNLKTVQVILLATAGSHLATSFKITSSQGFGCQGDLIQDWTGGEGGCQLPNLGMRSVSITNSEEADDNSFAVFFHSEDCDPDSEVKDGAGHFDEGCHDIDYSSYAVWNLDSPASE